MSHPGGLVPQQVPGGEDHLGIGADSVMIRTQMSAALPRGPRPCCPSRIAASPPPRPGPGSG